MVACKRLVDQTMTPQAVFPRPANNILMHPAHQPISLIKPKASYKPKSLTQAILSRCKDGFKVLTQFYMFYNVPVSDT
jgi:hypothetical protein